MSQSRKYVLMKKVPTGLSMINIIVLNSIHSRSGPNRHGVLSGGESHLWRDALSHHCLTNRSALIRGDLLESCKMSNSANSTITAKNELIMIKTCERASLEVNHGRLEVESHFMTVKLYKLSFFRSSQNLRSQILGPRSQIPDPQITTHIPKALFRAKFPQMPLSGQKSR